jgi:arylsulfatase A-like enzyme
MRVAGRIAGLFAIAPMIAVLACNEPPRAPHLLLVSIDTLRADHLSMNGYARATSPSIDAFTAQAWHFPDAVTPIPKTGPSFTTILSGLHPAEHGIDSNSLVIPDHLALLAEQLSAAGYQTGAFLSNPVLTKEKGYARGFSAYTLHPGRDGVDKVNEDFFAWAKTVDWDRPVFAWIHYMDPHGPYTPTAAYAGLFADDAIARAETRRVRLDYRPMSGFPPAYVLGAVPDYQRLGTEDRVAHFVSAYDAEIRYTDDAFAKLVASLRERGVYDDTAIVLVADHGESLGEHDYWFEHGWFPFDDQLRVPLVVKPPGPPAPRVVHGITSTLDVAPTVLAFAGVAPKNPIPGRDLATGAPGTEAVLVLNSSTYPERFMGLRTPEWKYLRRLRIYGPPVSAFGAEQLYDLRADPGELHDVAAEKPEQVAKLRDELDRRLAAMGPRPVVKAAPVDPALREQLRALGYTE